MGPRPAAEDRHEEAGLLSELHVHRPEHRHRPHSAALTLDLALEQEAPAPAHQEPAVDGGEFDVAAHVAGYHPEPVAAAEPAPSPPVFDHASILAELEIGSAKFTRVGAADRIAQVEGAGHEREHKAAAAHQEKAAHVHAAAQAREAEHDGWSAVEEEKAKSKAKQAQAHAAQQATAAHGEHHVTLAGLEADLKRAVDEERLELREQNARARGDLHARFEARRAALKSGADAGAAGQAVRLADTEQKVLDTDVVSRRAWLSVQAEDDGRIFGERAAGRQQELAQAAAVDAEKIKARADVEAKQILARGEVDAAALNETARKEAAAAREAGQRKASEARYAAVQGAAGQLDFINKMADGDVRARMADTAGEDTAKKIEQKGDDAAAKARFEAQQAANRVRAEAAGQATQILGQAKGGGGSVASAAAEAARQEKEHADQGLARLAGDLDRVSGQTRLAAAEARSVSADRIAAGLDALAAEEEAAAARLDAELDKRVAEVERKGVAAEKKLAAGKAGDLARLEKMVKRTAAEIDRASVEASSRLDAIRKQASRKAQAEVNKQLRVIAAAGAAAIAAIHKAVAAAKKQIQIDSDTAQQQLEIDQKAGAGAVDVEGQRQEILLQAEAQKREAQVAASGEAQREALDRRRDRSEAAMAGLNAGLAKELDEDLAMDVSVAQNAARALDKAMEGWGTDEDGVYRALRMARTPAEMRAIKAAYKTRTGRELDADLDDELSGHDLKKAKALESGDAVRIAVSNLDGAGAGEIKATLAAITDPAMKLKVAKQYQRTTGQRLSTLVKEELGEEAAAALPVIDDKLAVDDNKMKDVDQRAMGEAAAQLRRAMDGLGTDEDAIHRALAGRTPEEIETIKEIYRRHYQVELIDQLESEMSGTDLKEATAALSGNSVDAAVASLENAMDGAGTDEKKIHAVLEGVQDPEVRRQVIEEFERQTGRELSVALDDEMGGADGEVAQTLLIADNGERLSRAAAIRLQDAAGAGDDKHVMGLDEDAITEVLEKARTPEEREAMARAFEARTGRSLDAMLHRLQGTSQDLALSLAHGDQAGAAAARVAGATGGFWGTKEKAIYAQLEGKNDDERHALIKAYNDKYGQAHGGVDFDQMLVTSMSGLDRQKAQLLARDGTVPVEFGLEYAMAGLGTDEDAIKKLLAGKSPGDIARIRVAYRNRFHKDLDSELHGELSGRDWFQVSVALEGEPQDVAAKLTRARKLYEYERGDGAGSTGVGAGVTDLFSDSGEDLDRSHREMLELEGQLVAKGVVRKGPGGKLEMVPGVQLGEPEKARIAESYDWQNLDVESYQQAKDSVTNGMAEAATVVVGGAVSVLTAGAASPAVIAALSALAGGVSSMAVKAAMQGGAYGVDDLGIDAARTILEAATAGTMQSAVVLRNMDKLAGALTGPGATAARRVVTSVLTGASTSALRSMVDAGFDPEASRDLGDWMENLAASGGKGALTGALGSLVGHVHGASGNGLTGEAMHAPSSLAGAATRSLVSGFTGAVVPMAVSGLWDPSVFEGRSEDILHRFGKSGAIGAVQAGFDGMKAVREQAVAPRVDPAHDPALRRLDMPAFREEAPTAQLRAHLSAAGQGLTLADTQPMAAPAEKQPAFPPLREGLPAGVAKELALFREEMGLARTLELDAVMPANADNTDRMDTEPLPSAPSAAAPDTKTESTTTTTRVKQAASDEQTGVVLKNILPEVEDASGTRLHMEAQTGDTERMAAPPRHEPEDLDYVDRQKPAGYHEAMADLRAFYAQQQAEATQVTSVDHTRLDPIVPRRPRRRWAPRAEPPRSHFGIRARYDAREFGHGVTALQVRLHLQGVDATPEEIAHVRARTLAVVDKMYNQPGHTIRGENGQPTRLEVHVEFVDDPGQAHSVVKVRSGKGSSTASEWYSEANSVVYAHELGHHFGLLDEYHDPTSVHRSDPNSHAVFQDGSLMGNFWTRDPSHPKRKIAHPDTELKQRHVDQIAGDIAAKRSADRNQPAGSAPAPASEEIVSRPPRAPGGEGPGGDDFETDLAPLRLEEHQVTDYMSREAEMALEREIELQRNPTEPIVEDLDLTQLPPSETDAGHPSVETLVQRIDTAVDTREAAGYADKMAELAGFYDGQEVEARRVATVEYRRQLQFLDVPGAEEGKTTGFTGQPLFEADGTPKGPKQWVNYDARELGHGVTALQLRMYLGGMATSDEMARVMDQTHAIVDEKYNRKPLYVTDSAGRPSRLQVQVEFVDDPGDAHTSVTLHPGEGRSDQKNWFTQEDPLTYAHEVTHNLGPIDEYHDPRIVGVERPHAPGVHRDGSIMGRFWIRDPQDPTRQIADPDAGVKPRHLDLISRDLQSRREADPPSPDGEGAKVRAPSRDDDAVTPEQAHRLAGQQAVPAGDHDLRDAFDAGHTGRYDWAINEVQRIREELAAGRNPDQLGHEFPPEVLQIAHEFMSSPEAAGLSDADLAAVNGYTGSDFYRLNQALRTGDGMDEVRPYLDSLTQALAKLPDLGGPVVRGTSMREPNFAVLQAAMRDGTEWSDPAFVSATTDVAQAHQFRRDNAYELDAGGARVSRQGRVPVMFTIKSVTGKAVSVFSRSPEQAEVLFAPGTKLKILSIEAKVDDEGLPYQHVIARELVPEPDEE